MSSSPTPKTSTWDTEVEPTCPSPSSMMHVCFNPAPLRDLLIRIARTGVVQARWTDMILNECFRNILEKRPELATRRLERTRKLMNKAVADCLITGFEPLIEGLTLPDEDDRHVLAAAIRAGAQAIITFNLSDFPDRELSLFGIEAKHPDDFVLEVLHLAPGAICGAVNGQVAALKNPPRPLADVLDTFQANGLPRSVAQLRELFEVTGPSNR